MSSTNSGPSVTTTQNIVVQAVPAGGSTSGYDPSSVAITGGTATLTTLRGANLIATTSAPAQITTPDEIPGLTVWLDAQRPLYTAAYAAQCAALNDNVALWPDASGNQPAFTPAGGTPKYDPAGINGLPAVQLSGTGFLNSTTAMLTTAYNSALTYFVVAKANSGASGNGYPICAVGGQFWLGINQTTLVSDVHATGPTPGIGGGTLPSGSGIFGWSVSASAQTLMANKTNYIGNSTTAAVSCSQASTGSLSFATPSVLQIGAVNGASPWNGWIGEVLVYNATLTIDQMRQVYEYLANKWGYNTNKLVMCAGNSLTQGTAGAQPLIPSTATNANYPMRLWAALGPTYDVRHDAYTGRRLDQMLTETPTYSDPFVTRNGSSQIMVVWELTNSLQQMKAAGATISQLVRYCKARRVNGWKVVVATCLLRAEGGLYAGFANDRNVVNSYIRANWRNFADALCDFDAVPQLADPTNATYFNADKIHLVDAGWQVVANTLAPIVSSLA